MKLEKKAMVSVASMYRSDDTISGIRTGQGQDLLMILNILRYGYGARVKSVIESFFPRLKESMPPGKWEKIGKGFVGFLMYSPVDLHLIPNRFVSYLTNLKLSRRSQLQLKIDYTVYEVVLLPVPPITRLTEPSQAVQGKLGVQKTTRVLSFKFKGLDSYFVVSRTQSDVFVRSVDLKTARLVLSFQKKREMVSVLSKLNLNEVELGEFISSAIRFNWLSRVVMVGKTEDSVL